MSGARDLAALLAGLRPVARSGEFVFVSLAGPPDVESLALVVEDEGVSCVVPRETADARGWSYEFVAGWITLEVHSDLEAVGLTAAVSTALTRHGISCNVIAGFFHDHLLVPIDRREDALAVLEGLSRAGG